MHILCACVFFPITHFSTYSAKTLRRSIIVIGLVTLGLLIFETGWEATKAVNSKKDPQITITSIAIEDILPFKGDIWYDALVQVLLSTNIAVGVLPVITGKFIYKGDAVRYSISILHLNFFIFILVLLVTNIKCHMSYVICQIKYFMLTHIF